MRSPQLGGHTCPLIYLTKNKKTREITEENLGDICSFGQVSLAFLFGEEKEGSYSSEESIERGLQTVMCRAEGCLARKGDQARHHLFSYVYKQWPRRLWLLKSKNMRTGIEMPGHREREAGSVGNSLRQASGMTGRMCELFRDNLKLWKIT